MDTTRISIARVLALDVPLTWQDAVAVAQEAAMLSDVHAAMNSRPSLVSAETCFITRTGDLELPVMTDFESPDAVTELLREMLAGRDAPEALETLAFGHATRDMSGALQQFPITNRRAEIAKLATRALALQSQPLDPPARVAAPAVAAAPAPVWTPPSPPVLIAPAPEPPVAPPVPYVRQAPFRAADVVAPRPVPAAPVAVPPGAPDAELRRLRSRSVARAEARRRWSTRLGLTFSRMAQVVTWRPASPDPRILGAAFVITAAVVSVVWSGNRSARPAAPAPATAAPALAMPPPPPPAASAGPGDAVAAPNLSAPALTRPRLAAGALNTAAKGVGVTDESPAPAPAPTESTASPGAAAERGPAAASPGSPRSGVTVTLPALDPAPEKPLVTSPTESRAGNSRVATADRAEAAAVYSAGDDDVTPPVLRRQQLPSAFVEPPAEVPEDWPYLELVIDRAGAVEQVRLRAKQPAPGQTLYRHRMLLAAAKAWQFEPARRHGAPVRYVMRVPLEP